MMDDRKICDYFVIAGLPPVSKRTTRDKECQQNNGQSSINRKYEQQPISRAPITDITVINASIGELVPEGWHCIEKTPTDFQADLNHGSLNSQSIYLCYRRGTDRPPLTDIGVYYDNTDDLMPDSSIVYTSYYGKDGNVNNGNSRIYLTYRRSRPDAPCNQLVVTDICVILTNKGETPPHAFKLIPKNLNKALVGSNVFICYKKSMNSPPLLRYTPSIIDRYPREDLDCYQLPESIAMFCLPLGSTIECWPKENTRVLPLLSTFILTSNSGAKVYGIALTFYENFPLEKLDTLTNAELKKIGYFSGFEQIDKKLVVNKAICILSRWPFFELFEGFLNYLYKSVFRSFKEPLSLPIEVYISHFMMNIPFPSIQRPKIRIQLSPLEEDQLTLSNPFEETPLPLSGASYVNFLQTLDYENCMHVFLFALTEQKLLLHSLRLDVLTSVAEALTSLIFPFHWQCPFVPCCPLELCDVLSAPLPFIVGVDSRYFDNNSFEHENLSDLICVDLDTASIYMSETRRDLNLKIVPKKAYKNLRNSLQSIMYKLSTKMREIRRERPTISSSQLTKKLESQFGVQIQETFLQFMTFILKDFRSYLMPIKKQPSAYSTDPNSLFDFKGFISSREKAHHEFYSLVMRTQMFTRFIEERTFFSDKYTSLAFFDECLNRIESTENADFSTFQLIELDDRSKNDRTVFIDHPESLVNMTDYNHQMYRYNKFGPFNHKLFLKEPILTHFNTYRKISVEARPLDDVARLQPNYNSGSNLNIQQQNSTSSPMMMKRTKHEVKSAQRTAKRLAETPLTWSKCLISYCYSLWFVHLHSYVRANQKLSMKVKLKNAFNVLIRMQSLELHPLDEVCYRILMLLAGVYNQPILAIKILTQMKEHNVVPNAITYGYYNKAVLESEWKMDATDENLFWKKLRHLVQVTSYLRRLGKLRAERRRKDEIASLNHIYPESKPTNDLSTFNNVLPSLDKHDSLFSRQISTSSNKTGSSFREKKLSKNRSLFNDLATKSSCILKGNSTKRFSNSITHSEKAGLLINSQIYQLNSKDKKQKFERRRHKSEEQANHSSFNLLKIKEELLNVSSASSSTNLTTRKSDVPRSQSLNMYKQEDAHTLNTLKHDLNQYNTILEQHTRTPSTTSSQIDQLSNLNNSSSSDLTNHSHHKRTASKDSIIRRLSELSTNCSDEQINNRNSGLINTQQSMESLDSENSTFSPLKDAIKTINPFLSENKVASTLRSSFRTVKSFSKSQFANSSFFRTSLTRQQSDSQQKTLKSRLPENGVSIESLENNNSHNETKGNMTRSKTLPLSISSAASNESESLKKSNSSIETESAITFQAANEQPVTSEMSKSHSITDFNSIWSSKFTTNKHMDYLNSTFKFATSTMNRLSEIKSTLSSNTSSPIKPTNGQDTNGGTLPGVSTSSAQTSASNNSALFSNFGQNTSALFNNIASMVADKLPANAGPITEFYEYYMLDSTDGGTETDKLQSENSEGDTFFSSLEKQYNKMSKDNATPILKIEITSCSKCDKCLAILYDEEIMGEWSPNDSNLNTTCRYCETSFVPKLTIKIRYNSNFNSNNNGEASMTDEDKIAQEEESFKDYKKFSLAYLCPIVLRKELENVVDSEGDFCLTNPQFTLEHDIIYWNLVWYFKRVNLPTHLSGLYLSQFLKESGGLVNENLYEDIPKPIYYFWKKSYLKNANEETSSLVSALVTEKQDNSNKIIFNHILELICTDNLADAIRIFLRKRKTTKTSPKYTYSIYRDLLFLLFAAYDRSIIDHIAFDRVYRHAYDQLTSEEATLMRVTDKPPSLKATFCRRSFASLQLKSKFN